ncbi:MAG: Proline iminopeptidase [Methanocella sp. PtaU1.Bin125]|nr:MAG: Proline iminopeptidase [Methanocella sp. PtaU1.Bin125]
MPVIKTGDIEQYYEENGSGEPIVFIHGGLVSHLMWKPQVEHFSCRYRTITYDIRGHGLTGGSGRKDYTVELFAEDMRALLDALSLDRPVICGLSLGGMIAQAFATRHPDRLKALVLSDTAISTVMTPADKLQTYTLGWSLLPAIRIMGVKNFVAYAFWMAKLTRGDKWLGLNPGVRDYVRKEMLSINKDEMVKIYGAILKFRMQDLASVRVPTLITCGEFESANVTGQAGIMCRLIPDARMVSVPGGGHTSSMESPAEYNRVVEEFLNGLRRGDDDHK